MALALGEWGDQDRQVPELPEVEVTRRALEGWLAGRQILSAQSEPSARNTNLSELPGRQVTSVSRRGKYLLFGLIPRDLELVVHLGMTGGFRTAPSKHTRVTLVAEGLTLYFHDPRRFGRLCLVPAGDYRSLATLSHMGPEPLGGAFELDRFAEQARRAGMVKPWLLSQKPVAGLGNIYCDEALWQARLHPAQRGLTYTEAGSLHRAITSVLSRAVELGGSTLSDHSYQQPDGEPGYFQLEHRVYGRSGLPCPRCGQLVVKIRLAGRGTHLCPGCQKLRDS